jgi:hypothetical protein
MADPDPAAVTYHSRFDNWDDRASVRTKPRRTMAAGNPDLPFFPPESVPALAHPLVIAHGPDTARRILVHSLYQYLHFTTVLEQTAVLPVTTSIAMNGGGLELPVRMRADAFKITTDEAWHAQFCYEFILDVAKVTAVAPDATVTPDLVRRLAVIRAGFPPGDAALVDLVFAVVSETLVSGLLSDIPKDRRLPTPVRALVADHAADEGRHHAYFRDVLTRLWPQLSAAQRRLVGPRIPDFVHAFLDPDIPAARAILLSSGVPPRAVTDIVADSYQWPPARDIRRAARATVRCFRDVGALDDPATAAAFDAAGLHGDGAVSHAVVR